MKVVDLLENLIGRCLDRCHPCDLKVLWLRRDNHDQSNNYDHNCDQYADDYSFQHNYLLCEANLNHFSPAAKRSTNRLLGLDLGEVLSHAVETRIPAGDNPHINVLLTI